MNYYAFTSSIISVHSDGRYVKDGCTLQPVGCGLHRRTVDTIVATNLFNNCCVDSCVKKRYELLCFYVFDSFRPFGRTVRQGWPYPTVGTVDANAAIIESAIRIRRVRSS